MTSRKIPDLHDATLKSIEVDYSRSSIRLFVSAFVSQFDGIKPCVLSVSGFNNCSFSRHEPWGPSNSINSIHQDGDSIRIEIQSGDLITIEGFNGLSFQTDGDLEHP